MPIALLLGVLLDGKTALAHLKNLVWHTTYIQATAYVVNPREIGKCDVYTGHTATGTRPHVGVAAVDPSVFPFGTVFRVPGYGYAVAQDTGGAVYGHIVDLVFNTCAGAFNWGRRDLQVQYATRQH